LPYYILGAVLSVLLLAILADKRRWLSSSFVCRISHVVVWMWVPCSKPLEQRSGRAGQMRMSALRKTGSSAEEQSIWLPANGMRGSALRSERTFAALRKTAVSIYSPVCFGYSKGGHLRMLHRPKVLHVSVYRWENL
jgi:hypothetical protein